MRGNRNRHRSRACSRRSIPASAGEPPFGTPPCPPRRVYPRECGGTRGDCAVCPPEPGLSPRVRGTASEQIVTPGVAGLSPRVRGNQPHRGRRHRHRGSIPASAGEPLRPCPTAGARSVYPRECGGTNPIGAVVTVIGGLSPRVRGNRVADRVLGPAPGSIPASAGEPAYAQGVRNWRKVYPRECGGTMTTSRHRYSASGLSPRVRGNPPFRVLRQGHLGSIPASAGEPIPAASGGSSPEVYPRECGGTAGAARAGSASTGLSPRVRGNRGLRRRLFDDSGSIPASAGEPPATARAWSRSRVYPRECGGTQAAPAAMRLAEGLSPRVRGNLQLGQPVADGRGSIPASAGEPQLGRQAARMARVYPRECGGTAHAVCPNPASPGLSPRVRGNLGGRHVRLADQGSIPASAGEPLAAMMRRGE